ncbi:VIT1/CCC1 transporter family protein [Patescibacteria group bacterium]|nr:VIT1/CCC1 transporter family protein [Patescibacteria group bacterium]
MENTQEYTKKDLESHIKEEHKINAFSTYVREIIYGGNDGIVTTFAVVAGFTGASMGNAATLSFMIVFLFGLANLFADGTAMGLGNFLSVRANKKVYARHKKREYEEIEKSPQEEKIETTYLLEKSGFSENDAKTLTDIYAKNKPYWANFMMDHELEMENPEEENPLFKGVATFISFIAFGFIPLIPYIIFDSVREAFIGSCISTLVALVLLGILRFRTTKESPIKAILESVFIGGVSASIAYIVGLFFRDM